MSGESDSATGKGWEFSAKAFRENLALTVRTITKEAPDTEQKETGSSSYRQIGGTVNFVTV